MDDKTMKRMTRKFLEAVILEDEEPCRSTFRTDKLGNRVEVPYGGTYAVGRNGRGKGIRKGNTAKEDDTGQVHSLPPGHVLKIGANGKGVVVCPSESTYEKNGQIVVNRKKPKTESRKLSCLELVRGMKMLAEG